MFRTTWPSSVVQDSSYIYFHILKDSVSLFFWFAALFHMVTLCMFSICVCSCAIFLHVFFILFLVFSSSLQEDKCISKKTPKNTKENCLTQFHTTANITVLFDMHSLQTVYRANAPKQSDVSLSNGSQFSVKLGIRDLH
jgi:hypothetical protein